MSSMFRPPLAGTHQYRAVVLAVLGVGIASLVDLGLLIAGIVEWSFLVAMLAVGLLVSASMAIGFEVAREIARRAARPGDAELGGLAHDLRAPLSTTRTLLQLVESGSLGSLTPESRDALARAGIAAGRVDALLQDSLRATESDSRTPTADLDAVLDHAIEALKARIDASGAVIERGTLPTVSADPIALERTLTNLLQNALTHGLQAEPRIRVDAEQGRSGWVVSVADNGSGIPASLIHRAFDPGVRGRSSEQSPGFGLGLSTVRRLIEEQGGRVWIEPASPLGGACVKVQLPAAG